MLGNMTRRSKLNNKVCRAGAALALVAAALPMQAAVASAAPVENPKCADLGYALELKISRPASGAYTSDDGLLTVTINVQSTVGGDAKVIDWTSDAGVDAFILKAGRGGHGIYEYSPEAFSGSGLTTPLIGQNAISHISVCYDVDAGGDPASTPTEVPTEAPTEAPTEVPTEAPAEVPTEVPTEVPAEVPTAEPAEVPTEVPTEVPAEVPAGTPNDAPSGDSDSTNPPSEQPAAVPTEAPVEVPAESSGADDVPNDAGDTLNDAGDTPNGGGGTPNDAGDTPNGVGETPNAAGDTPNDASDTPNDAGDTPTRVRVPRIVTVNDPATPSGGVSLVLAGVAPPVSTRRLTLPQAGEGEVNSGLPLTFVSIAALLAIAGSAGISSGLRKRAR